MENIKQVDNKYWCAKNIEDCSKQCHTNQTLRNQVLFNGFDNCIYHTRLEKDVLCLCGKSIKFVNIISKDNIYAYIGDGCILRYYNYLSDDLNREKRTTFDCEKCGKRIKKTNSNHGRCDICNTNIDCKYKFCYKCFSGR